MKTYHFFIPVGIKYKSIMHRVCSLKEFQAEITQKRETENTPLNDRSVLVMESLTLYEVDVEIDDLMFCKSDDDLDWWF